MKNVTQRLIVVSNRLPVAVTETDEGSRLMPSPGGLVTALGPVLRERGGHWIGWPGAISMTPDAEQVSALESELGYRLHSISLTEDELDGYYHGFSNEVLWPLFHDFIGRCNFDPSHWPMYREVNEKFAKKVAEVSEPDDYVWIHDYQLIFVAKELARMGVERDLGYFLHIPFPSPDMFFKMPRHQQVLEGMLEYDLIGFQAPRDMRNLLDCVRERIPGAVIEDAGQERCRVRLPGGRNVMVGGFPISIDYDDFLNRSVENEVSEIVARVRASMPNRTIILGLDRLDYTKGIPHRLRALGNALERYPELHRRLSLLQVVIPSRTLVDDYRQLKDEIDRLVGKINGAHARAGWTPIHYLFRSLDPAELLAYYRVSEVALITPLKDGMNLVCKEYCACSLEGSGVLILSEFAGAAAQLADGALIVNPFDIEEVADAIYKAVMMPEADRRPRMDRLRTIIREQDVHRWVEDYLGAASHARGDA